MADTFTLDTSGTVGPLYRTHGGRREPGFALLDRHSSHMTWDDIGALPYGQLAQGYIEALFRWISKNHAEVPGKDFAAFKARGYRPLGFSDLAPETLARILKDCERWPYVGQPGTPREHGRHLWEARQRGALVSNMPGLSFPPLTLYLDDGLIYFREAA